MRPLLSHHVCRRSSGTRIFVLVIIYEILTLMDLPQFVTLSVVRHRAEVVLVTLIVMTPSRCRTPMQYEYAPVPTPLT